MNLHNDMIHEILSHLSFADLLVCRHVSKTWKRISNKLLYTYIVNGVADTKINRIETMTLEMRFKIAMMVARQCRTIVVIHSSIRKKWFDYIRKIQNSTILVPHTEYSAKDKKKIDYHIKSKIVTSVNVIVVTSLQRLYHLSEIVEMFKPQLIIYDGNITPKLKEQLNSFAPRLIGLYRYGDYNKRPQYEYYSDRNGMRTQNYEVMSDKVKQIKQYDSMKEQWIAEQNGTLSMEEPRVKQEDNESTIEQTLFAPEYYIKYPDDITLYAIYQFTNNRIS